MLALHVLASGSKGNASIIEDRSTGRGVLVDCGICKRDFFARCDEAGFDATKIDAILITHDHSDHTKCLGVVTRGLGKLKDGYADMPEVFALESVVEASGDIGRLDERIARNMMAFGDSLAFGNIEVIPFPTSHDAADSCGFAFRSQDGDSIGYMTDTGTVSEEAFEALAGVRLLALESNHDEKMLFGGPYPHYLKMRVASDYGHLSNAQAHRALVELTTNNLEHVIGMHLSQENNSAHLVLDSFRDALDKVGCAAEVSCASQNELLTIF